VRHLKKLRQNRPNGFGDIVLFRFSRWRLSAILDFQNFTFIVGLADWVGESIDMQHRSNLIKLGQMFTEIPRLRVFKMADVSHLGFVGSILGPPKTGRSLSQCKI